jgi:hypothetical protein
MVPALDGACPWSFSEAYGCLQRHSDRHRAADLWSFPVKLQQVPLKLCQQNWYQNTSQADQIRLARPAPG